MLSLQKAYSVAMNLRDLKYLVALAEHKHFGRAAEASFVSQPALSMQIKKLEKFLGVQLLERTNKRVLLTDAGMTIADQASVILNEVNELIDIAKLNKDPFSGVIRIGIIPTLAPYLLPHIIPRLSQAFPQLEFYLIEEQTDELMAKLKKGKIDAVILSPLEKDEAYHSSFLFKEEFLLAVNHQDPLSKRKKIKEEELNGAELLLLEEGHCLRTQALRLCETTKSKKTNVFCATSLETLRHMVASGVGKTLIPKLASKETPGITYLSFFHPKPYRMVAMLWRRLSSRGPVFEALSLEIKTLMAQCDLIEPFS